MKGSFSSTSHSFQPRKTWGQVGTDSQERINFERLRRYRLRRAQEAMKKEGLEALLLFDGDNIRYATGLYDYGWRTYFRYCVVTPNGEPVIFDTVGVDLECTRNDAPWIRDRIEPAIVWKNSGSAESIMGTRFADGLKNALKRYGIKAKEIGCDMPDSTVVSSLSKVDLKIVDGNRAISRARMVKGDEELELLKLACAFVDNTFWLAKNNFVKPGVKESEVKGKIANFLLGDCCCELYVGNVSSGGNTNPYYRGEHTDRMIRQGDMVILDIVAKYQGYWADFVRCWIVNSTPTKGMKEVYRLAYDSLQNAINAAKANATTSDVAGFLLNDELAGVKEECLGSTGLLNAGHGVGLSSHETPWITRTYSLDHPEKLAERMYFAVETYARKKNGIEAARLEDNFVVSENGPVVFSLAPFEEDFLS
jgi:Xaa-Pro aminopeptidase